MLFKPQKFSLRSVVFLFVGILILLLVADTAYKILYGSFSMLVPAEIPNIIIADARILTLLLIFWYMPSSGIRTMVLIAQSINAAAILIVIPVTHLAAVYPASGLEIIILYAGVTATTALFFVVAGIAYFIVQSWNSPSPTRVISKTL